MSLLPTVLLTLLAAYAVACGLFGATPGAPLWLRWPLPIWNWIAHDWRRPAAAPPRPDYARIAVLERELGIGDQEPERPMRRAATVCLTKGCDGDTDEIRTWSGVLVARIHHYN